VIWVESFIQKEKLLSQDLLHGFPLGQLVDQLVHVTDLARGGVFDLLHADAADQPLDQPACRIHTRGFGEEGLQVDLFFDLSFHFSLAVTGQPADDLIHLCPGAPFSLRLGNVEGMDARECIGIDSWLCHEFNFNRKK